MSLHCPIYQSASNSCSCSQILKSQLSSSKHYDISQANATTEEGSLMTETEEF